MARLDSAQLFRYAALVVTGLTLTLLLILFGCTAPPADPPQTPSPRDVPSSARASSPAQQGPSRTAFRHARLCQHHFRRPAARHASGHRTECVRRDRAGMLSPKVAHDPALLYVPDSTGSRVTVISQRTRRILRILHTGSMSQHVTPSYDLRHLYTNSSSANALIAIDPRTGKRAGRRRVPRPYNLYFTPDGRQAVGDVGAT